MVSRAGQIMATAIETRAADKSRARKHEQLKRSPFFLWSAIACAAIAFFGFLPTYWMQLPAGTFIGPPLIHIHGFLSSAWIVFLISQAWLISKGRISRHREWGLAGIALATLVVAVGFVTAIASLDERLARGEGDRARAFLATPLTAITLFAAFTAAAIWCNRRPDWHKRLMIAGTVSLVNAAAARFAFLIAVGHRPGLRPGLVATPPELMPTIVGLLLQLIVVAGMFYDKRTRGSVHPAWIVSFAISALALIMKVPLSHTAGWLAFADWAARIAG